ncbi:ribosome 60S biogenesis N-terminal-domain-containing protein [Catenaria anguillulae PL171]|uniref:Ribosome 60S biogenesis N-terminal-domain-containing protein n=1 Tax=Catenaria anguillulae PL171 TaxID=765915 RepID=A0A1Y2HVE4_9FUNG|nr:ribosome 60S biogenesis N-terminal-domain-containing protein [Catenaria anguillulae PL171]
MSFTGLRSFSSAAPPPPATDPSDAMEVDLPQVQLPAGAVFENDLSHLRSHRRREDTREHGGNKSKRGQDASDEEDAQADAADHVEEEDQTLFASAEDMARALESSHMELLMRACRQFKFHLRLLFQPAHELQEQSMRTVVEFVDANPDLGQVWSAFNWAQAHQPLQPLIMDIIALLLSVPIPLPTHRAPLFRHLLKHHTELIRSTLVRAIHPPTVIATLRVLLHATRAGLWRDILDAQLIVPFSALALMTKKSQKVSIRSTYLQYLTALLRVEDVQLRHRLVEDREFLGPMLKFMDQDAPEIVTEWLAALALVLDDVKLTRALKSTFFNGYFIDNVRRLYNASEAYRTPTHAFLVHACTQPGRGMCHRDAGVYGGVAAAGRAPQQGQQQVHGNGPANRVLANLLTKLDLTDALQVELMAGILTASPELVSVFTRSMVVSMDPRPSARWMANVNVVARIIGLPVPSLLDPSVRATSTMATSVAEIYPLAPPPIANLLVHICPSPPLARSSLHRGLSLTTSPIALFFTLRLVLAILEKLDLTLAAIAQASEWWTSRDADAARAWQDTRTLVLVETLKLVPEVQAVIKVLFAAQSRLDTGTYELPEKLEPAARAIEEQEGVTPAMVYLCALRTLRVLASCAPTHLPATFDAAKLLSPLPPPELCPDLLGLFMACPPQLSPHALATLLRVHAEGSFTDMSAPLLVKVLASAPVFVGGGQEEVAWWLHEFPRSGEVIVFVTNLLGEAIKGVYALVDRITQAVESVGKGEKKLPFSPMVVALAQQLANQSEAASLGPAADVYARLVLMRVLATQVDPAPLQHLLESLGITNIAHGVPAEALESIAQHPVLSTSRLLQTLGLAADASKQDLAAALDSLSQALDNTDSDTVRASQLVTIYTHPALARALARDPEAVAEFTVRQVPSELDAVVVEAVAKQFRSLIVSGDDEQAPVTNSHAHAIVAVYTALNLRLALADVPTTRLSARQWLTLLPALDTVPAAVAMHLFTAPDVSEARIELMVQVLSGKYPLLRSKVTAQVGRDAESVDVEQLPVDCLDRIAGAQVVNAGPKKALATILARYSSKFHVRLVDIVDESLDLDLVEALVDASVAIGEMPTFALQWIDGVDVNKVKHVLAKVSPAVVASTASLRVALVVAECIGWDQVVPRPDVMPTLASVVVGYRACAGDAEKLAEYFKKIAAMIVRRGDSVPAAVYAFISKVLPKEGDELMVEVDDAVALVKVLVGIDAAIHSATAKAALKLAHAWSAHWLAKHTPTIVAEILAQVMSAAAAAHADESSTTPAHLVHLLSIARALMSSAPSRLCKQDHLYTLIGMYKATMHPRDHLIYAMFHLYESQAATNLGQLLLFWGKPPTTTGLGGPRTFEESLDLIQAETMLRTVRYFPLDVDVLDVEPSVGAMQSVLAEASDANMAYDPRFFLSLAIKYLEQGNALELRTLLEKNLVGLAIAALASEYETTRRAGLAVLDEFSNLIDTSNLKGKASLVRTLDLLRQQIPSRDDDELVRLPAVITTFLAQAVALLLRPDHDAYEPVHLALLSRPLLDMDGIPALNDMLNRASRERGWMLMFLESTMRSAKDLTTFLHRHVFDTVQLLSSAPLGTAAVHVQDALRIALHACVLTSHQDEDIASAADRAVYTTGILPCLHHVAETTNSLPTVLAIARAMAALTTRTAVHRAHVSSIARTCLSTLRALGNHPARDHAMWLNVLDAVVPLAASEVASVRATAVWAVSAMEASEVAMDVGADEDADGIDSMSGCVRERVLAAPPSAVVPTLEQLYEDQADMYRRVVLALASVDQGCWCRAVAVFGDEKAWGVRRL